MVNKTIQTFIFVHNQDIILDFKKANKFNELDNLKYVFVGNGKIDKLSDYSDIIISRELTHNIEEYPKLTSFTGWYSLWKNDLITCDYVNLFEYDINLLPNFINKQTEAINNDSSIIGYIPYNVHDYAILKNPIWSQHLISSIRKTYGIDVLSKINLLSNDSICSMTSNHTFRSNILDQYMLWIEPMIDDIKISEYSGHEIERSIFLFYVLNSIKDVSIIPNILKHFQFDSHGTQPSISSVMSKQRYNELL